MRTFYVFVLVLILGLRLGGDAMAETVEELLKRGDYAAAVPALIELAEAGNVQAQGILGGIYLAKVSPPNYLEGIKWSRKAAEGGDESAQFNLGIAYLRGAGVPVDAKEAASWLDKAARQGLAAAQDDLGVMYYAGLGVELDELAGWRWLLAAANQGFAQAEVDLGAVYVEGIKGREDDPRALELFTEVGGEQAAANFRPSNQPREFEVKAANAALPWYKKAAEQGLSAARVNLADLYLRGSGVTQDYAAAVRWLTRVAVPAQASKDMPLDVGTLLALMNLAALYKYGWGVDKDEQKAAELRQRAETGGIANIRGIKQLGAFLWDPNCGDLCMGTLTAGPADAVHYVVRPKAK
jgi:TPR repeat protein